MRRRIRLRAGLVVIAFVGAGLGARADEAADAAALRQFEEGRAALDKGDYERALAKFSASIAVIPSPNTRLYIARCHRGLGRTASAYTELRRASLEAADRLNATGERRYAATREAALAEALELEPKVPHLTVAVPADAPPSAVVTLDGAPIPRSNWGSSMDVDPGAHTLAASAPRRVPFSQGVRLDVAESRRVQVALQRIPTATVALAFRAKPAGLALEIDGKPLNPAEAESAQELDVGEHTVVIRAPGYHDFVWHERLADGQTARVEVALAPGAAGGTPKWLFFGVAALSAIGLASGAYLAIDATSRASDEKAKDALLRDPGEQDKIRSESITANILFIGGAALAAGAVVLAFTTSWKGATSQSKTGIALVPWLHGAAGGLGAAGRF